MKEKKKAATAKSGKAKLDAGAAKIRKLEADAAAKGNGQKKPEPIVIHESKRPIKDILNERVRIADQSVGLSIDENTPLEESLRILDWATSLSDHAGFMVGDVVNFGQTKWGDKYTEALNVTGRAKSTLWGYAETARRIPLNKRVAELSFSHHRELIRLPDSEKLDDALKKLRQCVDDGKELPTRNELRVDVRKATPAKVRKQRQATKGRKAKREPEIAYVPTPEEESALDVAEEAIVEARSVVKDGGVEKIVSKLPNKDKQRWVKHLVFFKDWYVSLERVTGY